MANKPTTQGAGPLKVASGDEWDGTPPVEHMAAEMHLLSDRGEPPRPARYDPETGVWWVKPGVPFPIDDMHSCGFRYISPVEKPMLDSTPPTTDYRLEVHPTTNPTPVAIWFTENNQPVRCVAALKGDAAPTMAEAQAMLTALKSLPNG